MKLIPKSSFWRTILLVSLVLILSQISTLLFATYYLYLPGVKQNAQLVALQVDTISLLVGSERRQEFIERIRREHHIDISTQPDVIADDVEGLFVELFVEPMRSRLGPGAQVEFGIKPGPSLWVNTPQLGDLWMRFPLENFGRYEALAFIAWMIGTPAIAFILTLLFVRQLNRPLKRLANAARRIGRGEVITNLTQETGPREIQAVNKAFMQMSKDLQQASRERALLLAGISHDLRTPLTRMRLTAELLGESEFTEGMIRDIEDMNAILNQFILFVRDGSDEKTETGDLNEVLVEVVSQFESEGAELRTDLRELPAILLKRLSLKRMFGNLIGNAIRHGGGKVDVSTSVMDGEICVIIADRGPGLSEKELHDLFQPFARGDQSRSTKGSGLGLAIVKRVVDMHHGRVQLRNREGGGLEAVVNLPLTGEFVPPDSMMQGIR
jgi:two-component system osmolarity sensor histidine kinase EnvZ